MSITLFCQLFGGLALHYLNLSMRVNILSLSALFTKKHLNANEPKCILELYIKEGWTMRATIVDLRYRMNDILKALARNEKVTVLYRGKVKGVLVPTAQKKDMPMIDHPFFGMSSQDSRESVLDELDNLRKFRYDDI